MKQKLQQLAVIASRNKARAVASVLSAGPLLAMAVDPTTAEEAINQGKTTVLAIVGVGGLAMVLVALAAVGWGVGVKFIKRLRPSA